MRHCTEFPSSDPAGAFCLNVWHALSHSSTEAYCLVESTVQRS
jgi:hypothetical protein